MSRERSYESHRTSLLFSAPLLEAEQERELLAAALQGDARATRLIVQSHMRLVAKIANRYRRSGVALEDLIGEGILGLMEALRRFDLDKGARFSVYAGWWIRARVSQYACANRRAVGMPSTRNARAILREVQRAERRLSQRLCHAPSSDELAREMHVSADEVAQVRVALGVPDLSLEGAAEGALQLADDAQSPEAALAERELGRARQERVQRALGALSARERQLVRAQYLDEGTRTLSELGRDCGVSRQRLGQVLANAREKLKSSLTHEAPAIPAWDGGELLAMGL